MKDLLRRVAENFGYSINGIRYTPKHLLNPDLVRTITFDDAVCRLMFERGPDLSFVQVGVFDGIQHDPLRKYIERLPWNGILIEPQSRAVASLRKLYADNDKIQIVHAALNGEAGVRSLYTIAPDQGPEWAGGLASFDRDVILKHREQIPDIESMIHEEQVACVAFSEVLKQLTSGPDILQIDTEGADAYILSLFPFSTARPAIVHWEVKHLSKSEKERCMDLLAPFGYKFAPSGSEDMLATTF